jgi:chromate transporter
MKAGFGLLTLTAHLALLSSISFGGFPTVLPDVRTFVVTDHGWMTNQDFANLYAIAQMLPGPNMILMMGLLGWTLWGLPGALAAATATFAPPAMLYFAAWQLWDRFRDSRWQRVVRSGLAPVTIGLILASGIVIARATDGGWRGATVTGVAVLTMLTTRISPLWLLFAGGAVGGFGLLN